MGEELGGEDLEKRGEVVGSSAVRGDRTALPTGTDLGGVEVLGQLIELEGSFVLAVDGRHELERSV